MSDSSYIHVDMYPKLVNQDSPAVRRSFTSKLQLTGWRFMLHRTAASITEGSVTPYVEPLLSYHRMFTLGLIATCLGVIVCFIYSLINPAALIHNNSIIEDTNNHGFYVVTDNVVHPVFNVTSARLILGQPVKPVLVKPQELMKFPLGEKIGIPDAPDMTNIASADANHWMLCDHQTQIWVYHPQEFIYPAKNLHYSGVIVSNKGKFWLLWDHYRSKLPNLNREILYSLGFAGRLSTVPAISDAMLNSIPQKADYFPPFIADYGAPVAFSLEKFPALQGNIHVGTLLRIDTGYNSPRYFLTEKNGIQEIPSTVDALFRFIHPNSTVDFTNSDWLFSLPYSQDIDLSQYPNHVMNSINESHPPYLCMFWKQVNNRIQPSQLLFFRTYLPSGQHMHQSVLYTNTVFATQESHLVQISDDILKGSTFWLSPLGITYGLPPESFHALNITQKPVLIPWSIFSLYSRGSALTRENALIIHMPLGDHIHE